MSVCVCVCNMWGMWVQYVHCTSYGIHYGTEVLSTFFFQLYFGPTFLYRSLQPFSFLQYILTPVFGHMCSYVYFSWFATHITRCYQICTGQFINIEFSSAQPLYIYTARRFFFLASICVWVCWFAISRGSEQTSAAGCCEHCRSIFLVSVQLPSSSHSFQFISVLHLIQLYIIYWLYG